MHCSGPLPLTSEGPEQGFRVKTAKMQARENTEFVGMHEAKWDLSFGQTPTLTHVPNTGYPLSMFFFLFFFFILYIYYIYIYIYKNNQKEFPTFLVLY